MGLFSLFKPSKQVVVVDGLSLYESVGMGGKIAPRNQLQVLRRLSRFAQQEKIELVAVLSGSPLHKAPNGEKFEDVKVVYSESEEAHPKFLVKTARSQGGSPIVIVSKVEVESQAIGAGLRTMRMSTFRKAFDVGNLSEGGEDGGSGNSGGGSGGGRGNRERRPPRRRSQNNNNNNSSNAPEKKIEREPRPSSDADAINELIDLVD